MKVTACPQPMFYIRCMNVTHAGRRPVIDVVIRTAGGYWRSRSDQGSEIDLMPDAKSDDGAYSSPADLDFADIHPIGQRRKWHLVCPRSECPNSKGIQVRGERLDQILDSLWERVPGELQKQGAVDTAPTLPLDLIAAKIGSR